MIVVSQRPNARVSKVGGVNAPSTRRPTCAPTSTPWTVFVDNRADERQLEAIGTLLSGQAGGPAVDGFAQPTSADVAVRPPNSIVAKH